MTRLTFLRNALGVLLAAVVTAGPAPRAQTAPGPGKRALLIGVSKYAHGGNPSEEWWDLGSDADVAALRTLLVDKFAFQSADILTLSTRSETTRASILAAFEKLNADTRKGDVVFIHYSGHGTPVRDQDGDEFDGLDESIVPSDYVSRKNGARNITDDTIGALMRQLAAREPASITLTFDSCFSGSQTRGGRMVTRGGNNMDSAPAPRQGQDPDVTGLGGRDGSAPGYVVLSAARNDQMSYETDDGSGGSMGLLSYALVKELREAGPDTTYRDLFDGVFETMMQRNPVQTPQLEGDLDARIMSGAALPAQSYLNTLVDGAGQLILDAGSLHGVTAGSEFSLYPRGTKTFSGTGTIATATVDSVRATTAILKPSAGVAAEDLRSARAVETAHKYGDPALRVDVTAVSSLSRAPELVAAIQRIAKESGMVRPTRGEAWDLKLTAVREGVDLIRADGTRVVALPDSPGLGTALSRAIQKEARWRAIAALEHKDSRIGVEVLLVPVDATLGSKGIVTSAAPRVSSARARGGQIVLAIGDHFMIKLRNTGTLDAFVTVLDLSPDGCITALWPRPVLGRAVQENKLRAAADPRKSDWTLIPLVYQVADPTGNEILKAIATDVPADFGALFATPCEISKSRGPTTSETTPVGRLLARVARGDTRGGDQAAEPPDPTRWATGGFTFIIR